MKYLLIAIMMFTGSLVLAQETCQVNSTETVKEQKEDINTKTPKELEGAEIIVRTKDGKERVLKADEFKVVKRKQQFKVTERVIVERVECQPKVKVVNVTVVQKPNDSNNLVMLGFRQDQVDLDKSVNGNVGTLSSKKGLVLDLSYMRRNVINDNVGLGIGIDTNSTLRGIVGLEF